MMTTKTQVLTTRMMFRCLSDVDACFKETELCYIVDDDDGDKVTVAKMILLKTKKMVMKMVMTRCLVTELCYIIKP